MHKILLVDTDSGVLQETKSLLNNEGYEVFSADTAQKAIELAKLQQPHLILMEIVLPGTDGVETCIELKKIPSLRKTLVVFYTRREEDYSQISAFNAGADDYILKSIKPRLLISRIKAILKRYNVSYATVEDDNIVPGNNNLPITIDRDRYLVLKEGEELVLPRKEFELLALLFSSPRKVFTRNEIADKIWGYEVFNKNRTIDVHIGRLREKIGERYIKTVKGIGYSLEL